MHESGGLTVALTLVLDEFAINGSTICIVL